MKTPLTETPGDFGQGFAGDEMLGPTLARTGQRFSQSLVRVSKGHGRANWGRGSVTPLLIPKGLKASQLGLSPPSLFTPQVAKRGGSMNKKATGFDRRTEKPNPTRPFAFRSFHKVSSHAHSKLLLCGWTTYTTTTWLPVAEIIMFCRCSPGF